MRRVEDLKALTSLRFFAAASIVWLHAKLYFPWAQTGEVLPLSQGVSFFFVLSGFILTHVYSGESALSYKRFLKARIGRLWPLHLATLVSVVVFVPHGSQSYDGPGLSNMWIAFVVNFFLMQSWIPTTAYMFSWNSVSWSISTEMFFYAMFPFLLVIWKGRPSLVLLIGALPLVFIGLITELAGLQAHGDVFEISTETLTLAFPPARLFEFCVGMVSYRIWLLCRDRLPTSFMAASMFECALVIATIVWLTVVFYAIAPWTASSSALAQWYERSGSCFLFAFLFIGLAASHGVVNRLLSLSFMVTLGQVSFAIYMVHQIVMKIISLTFPFLGNPVIVLGSILAAAFAGHFWIELPGRRWIVMGRPRSTAPAGAIQQSPLQGGVPESPPMSRMARTAGAATAVEPSPQ